MDPQIFHCCLQEGPTQDKDIYSATPHHNDWGFLLDSQVGISKQFHADRSGSTGLISETSDFTIILDLKTAQEIECSDHDQQFTWQMNFEPKISRCLCSS